MKPEPCPYCNGTALVVSGLRYGDSHMTCPACNGRGHDRCLMCGEERYGDSNYCRKCWGVILKNDNAQRSAQQSKIQP